jgi:hypothetical protein
LGKSSPENIEGASIFDTDSSTGEKKARKTKYKSTNAAAPVSASELYAQEAKAYIEAFAAVAQKEQAAHGIPASISLAQGLIESRAGTSKLAKSNNNHFGMKCIAPILQTIPTRIFSVSTKILWTVGKTTVVCCPKVDMPNSNVTVLITANGLMA